MTITAVVCPYCRTAFGPEEQPILCEGCGTAHHADCYAENGGCTIFGCSKAPGDEPKMSVSTPELAAVPVAAPATAPPMEGRVPPPPPPPRGGAPATAPATTEELRQVANNIVPSMFGGFGETNATSSAPETEARVAKKRTSFIILGALLGALGAHNFYAGYYKKAGIQLAITVVTLGFASPMSWMWAVIDICTVDRDNWGVQFES